jgi:hypothetical protein
MASRSFGDDDSAAAAMTGADELLLVPSGAAAGGERRFALLIGNARYRSKPLSNPIRDTRLIGEVLRALGFSSNLVENATLAAMRHAVDEFAARLADAGPEVIAFFYYAGHGVLPVRGTAVTLQVRLARWQCRNRRCQRQTFADRLPEIARSFARRTRRAAELGRRARRWRPSGRAIDDALSSSTKRRHHLRNLEIADRAGGTRGRPRIHGMPRLIGSGVMLESVPDHMLSRIAEVSVGGIGGWKWLVRPDIIAVEGYVLPSERATSSSGMNSPQERSSSTARSR